MAVDLFIDPPTYSFSSLDAYRYFQWDFLPDPIQGLIARECQYLELQLLLLERLHFTEQGKIIEKPYISKITNNVRSGVIKASLLLYASIAEAVLRYIAESRKFSLPNNERQRTFGRVLESWESYGAATGELKDHWHTLQELKDIRNNIHLFKAAESYSSGIDFLLVNEIRLLESSGKLIEMLSKLEP